MLHWLLQPVKARQRDGRHQNSQSDRELDFMISLRSLVHSLRMSVDLAVLSLRKRDSCSSDLSLREKDELS